MVDDRYTEEERRAKEDAYREYLKLRQEAPKVSITETPYGSSELRRKQKAEEESKAAYRKAREEGRRGVKPGRSSRRQDPERSVREKTGRERSVKERTDGEKTGRERTGREPQRSERARAEKARRDTGRSHAPEGQKKSRRVPKPILKEGVRKPPRHREEENRPIAENSTIASTIEKKRKRSKKTGGGFIKNRRTRRFLIILAAILLGLIVLFAGAFAVVANTLGNVGSLDMEKNNLAISKQAKRDLKGFKNIAVLGVDSRDMEDDAESRSDAMVVVSINKDTNEVKMFSVFRDTMMDLGGDHGLDKLTHAYSYGGAEMTVAALNRNMDLNISKAVVINWKTVAEVIDGLGGITIDVDESEIEELNKYVKGTSKATGSERKEIEEPGKQTLNGAQAVTYARIRQDNIRGDYRRNERMKVVMSTTFKKAKQADLFTLKRICDSALPDAKTNLTTTEMIGMALNFKKYDMTSSTTGWPYDVEGWIGTAGGGSAWYGPPVTLESNVKKLHKKFFEIGDYEPSDDVKRISNEISELTGLY